MVKLDNSLWTTQANPCKQMVGRNRSARNCPSQSKRNTLTFFVCGAKENSGVKFRREIIERHDGCSMESGVDKFRDHKVSAQPQATARLKGCVIILSQKKPYPTRISEALFRR